MIIVTGAAGFIGSALVGMLNNKGHNDIIIVDDFSSPEKNRNIEYKSFAGKIDRELFFQWLEANHDEVDFIFHIGARTDTTEFDMSVFDRLNLNYSIGIWLACVKHQIPLVYASSAATYGSGEFGYKDDHELIAKLKPLNPYGVSKNEFDKWALHQENTPPFWAGMKFFNVYGPNEYHKGRMASVIFHAYHQILKTGKVKLFKSHKRGYADGEQLRDFIYVRDVVAVLYYLMNNKVKSGIYNLGTGEARSFKDLVSATFNALGKPTAIEFIPTPEDIRDKYQYFTEASMGKLRSAGYTEPFHSLESGIRDYVQGYLLNQLYY